MAKPEWGLKRMCRDCGKRFYDFHRDPIVCPGCQAVFDPLAMLRPRRSRAAAPAAEAAAPKERLPAAGDDENKAADVESVEDEAVVDTEGDDSMIKEAADLGDDADDIPKVIGDDV